MTARQRIEALELACVGLLGLLRRPDCTPERLDENQLRWPAELDDAIEAVGRADAALACRQCCEPDCEARDGLEFCAGCRLPFCLTHLTHGTISTGDAAYTCLNCTEPEIREF